MAETDPQPGGKTESETLSYANPWAAPRPVNAAGYFWVALICGLVPMAVGTGVFVTWLVTRSNSLPIIGLFTIMGGGFLFVVGVATLVKYLVDSRSRPVRHWLVRGALAATILLANFPLACTYMSLAQRHTVVVTNKTSTTIDQVVLSDPIGKQWKKGPIAPGASVTFHLHSKGEGSVDFTATSSGRTVKGTAIGFITTNQSGEHATIVLNPDGSYTAQ